MKRRQPERSRDAGTHPAGHPVGGWIVLLPALAAIVVWYGASAYFFTQDDFAGLARTSGLLPRLAPPWRWLSGQLWFDGMRAVFGLQPAPWHVASILLHAATGVAVAAFLSRRVGAWAAVLGATFYVTHPAPFTAVYSISGIGEILATLLALLAWNVVAMPDARRWWAPPLYLGALLSKETILLLPAVIWIEHRLEPASERAPLPRGPLVAMAVLGGAFVAAIASQDVFGVRSGLAASAPYAMELRAVLPNLATYLAWSVDFVHPLMRDFTDRSSVGDALPALAVAAAWVAGLVLLRGRRRAWWATGAVTFVLFLAPVLALPHHTYHYYLLAPLLGVAVALASGLDGWLAARGRSASRGTVVAATAVAAIALMVNGALLVRKIELHPFSDPRLRSDATVDRALIASRVADSLRTARLEPGVRLAFWSPIARAQATSDSSETYYERNVRAALFDGLGVRVLFPQVVEVEFVRHYESRPDPWRWAVYRVDGRLLVASSAQLDSVLPAFGLGGH